MKKIFSLLFVLMIGLFFIGCSDNNSNRNGNSNISSNVGTSGGSLSTLSGDVKLDIPEGALSSDTTITIASSSRVTPSGNLAGVYDFTPDGQTFNSPVTIRVKYDPNALPAGVNQADLKLARLSVNGGAWEIIDDSTVDTINHIVSGQTNHLSTYSIVLKAVTENTYGISGTVSGDIVSGVTINLTGAATASVTTDANGNYSFTGLAGGNYTVTPSKTGYSFSPSSTAITVSGADESNINFTANVTPTYNISGTVSGAVISGVTITLTGTSSSSATTDASGNYIFSGAANGSYTMTASKVGYIFNPTSISVTVDNANLTGQNFTATASAAATYSISGRVTLDGAGVQGVAITLTGSSPVIITTDASGNYTFSNAANGSYTLTASSSIYTFNPTSISVIVDNANRTGQNFVATVKPITVTTAPAYLHYTLPNQYQYEQDGLPIAGEAIALFSGYTLTNGIDYGGGVYVSGYKLDQFVDKNTVNAATPNINGVLGTNDARQLYAVVVRSNQDGFSNRTKFYNNGSKTEVYNVDLRWDQFEKGYLLDLNYSGKTYYEATLTGEFAKMFNLKYAYDLYMFRKIDVKRPDAAGSFATFEVGATTDSYVDDTNFTDSNGGLTTTKFTVTTINYSYYGSVRAISLNQFLTDYVTNTPGSYTYKIVGLDGISKEGFTYANMQQAYYLPDLDIIIISGSIIYYPVRIELVGAIVEYNYSAKNPPAYGKAYNE